MCKKGVNKVIVIGTLGKDPEVRYMPSGDAVTKVTVATSETWKYKQSGEDKERTEWHNVVFFGKLAEIAGEYLKKGSQVYVEGSLRTRKWQDKDGRDRYTTEIVADAMQMLGGRAAAAAEPDDEAPAPTRRAAKPATKTAARPSSESEVDFRDDDIPF